VKSALIIGSGCAGIQASLDLADCDVHVHLIETKPFLSVDGEGNTKTIDHSRSLEVFTHPNISVATNTEALSINGEAGNFKAEILHKPRFVDLGSCTACGDCVDICPVTLPDKNHKVIHLDGQPGCMVLDSYGIPPCSNACPGGIKVQGYIALIAQRRFQEAINLIREAIPFPGICGRVCTHPCEINCRRNEIDKPVAVRLLKRFVSDWELEHSDVNEHDVAIEGTDTDNTLSMTNKLSEKRIAVVGAGPGGMTVADRLARMGYKVTVFEKLPVIGGMMTIGIPAYRLPFEVITQEYQRIHELGVEIKLNTSIGPDGDYSIDSLFENGYEAICLAIGAHKGIDIAVQGNDLPGVVQGIDVLKTINLTQHLGDPGDKKDLLTILTKGLDTRVGIIGGGNTAMDVARSIKRLGVKKVQVLYRRTRAEMPCMPSEIEEAQQEGVEIEYLVAPTKFIGDPNIGVKGIECIQMELGEMDASGRRRPIPVPNSEFILEMDLVVLAIGQSLDQTVFDSKDGIDINERQCISVSGEEFMTTRSGVFAVGDAVIRENMVIIEAIGMAKKAARAMDKYLRGELKVGLQHQKSIRSVANREMSPAELIGKPRVPVPTISIEERLTTYAEVELGYSVDQAISEAKRCLACGPCSECQACVNVCKPKAIDFSQTEKTSQLEVGTVIYADKVAEIVDLRSPIDSLNSDNPGIYQVPFNDPLFGSAVSNQAYLSLFKSTNEGISHVQPGIISSGSNTRKNIGERRNGSSSTIRKGVFICQCGTPGDGEISRIIDVDEIRKQAGNWQGVVYAETLPFSCSTEGTRKIKEIVNVKRLDQVVIAGCTCCSIDQVCYSCTYQRVRCKDQLHIFESSPQSGNKNRSDGEKFVFLNIREQCAWVHRYNPEAATAKAMGLIKGAVSSTIVAPHPIINQITSTISTLILGLGNSGQYCSQYLDARGINVELMKHNPESIRRSNGLYEVVIEGQANSAGALVLSPENNQELNNQLNAFDGSDRSPKAHSNKGRLETDIPGIFIIDPNIDPSLSGAAAASKVAGWFGQMTLNARTTSIVDQNRCRACGTCAEICELGAPELLDVDGQVTAWIDPIICVDCGVCAVHCPSGAISSYHGTDGNIEAVLESIFPPLVQV